MKQKNFSVSMEYVQDYLPSKRHKNARSRVLETEIGFLLPAPETEEEFPVAFIVRRPLLDDVMEVRAYDGRLFSRLMDPKNNGCSVATFGTLLDEAAVAERKAGKKYPADTAKDAFSCDSVITGDDLHERLAEVEKIVGRYLFFGGEFWKECPEPMYVVRTWGAGHGRGGVSVRASFAFEDAMSADRYFAADRKADAVKKAAEIARERGNEDRIAVIEDASDVIEVLMPEMVKAKPHVEREKKEPELVTLGIHVKDPVLAVS